MVKTGSVKGRRDLRLATVDAVLADVKLLEEADARGTLTALGNWSLGQACGHIATWIDHSYAGLPPQMTPPWFIKLIMKTQRARFVGDKPMSAGIRVPGVKGGTVGTEELSTAQGVARLRDACARLKAGAPTRPHDVFGPLTAQEWIRLNCNHASLHLSFFVPR